MNEFPKLAILVSGNGSNLQSIIDHVEQKKLQAKICVVISNNANAFALKRAKQAGIPTVVISHKIHTDRAEYDRSLIEQLQKFGAQWIALAGFMRILGSDLIAKYEGRILNIHPSLLPKFPGLKAIEQALNSGEKATGVTVHYVNDGVDTGPVILQERVEIDPTDDLDRLKTKIQAIEHQIYPKALQKVLWGK